MTDNPVPNMNEAIERARAHAPYLRMLMDRFPEVLADDLDAEQFSNIDLKSENIHQALRIAKGKLALRLALADLAGAASLETIVSTLSSFADHALDASISAAISAHVPGAEPRGFAAIGLGKHGGQELNYSSDIDPIFLFDPATLPHREREAPEEAAVRIGRRVLELMQARDGDGYVFRVDLRLRPNPEVTPIVLPVDAAISYYESSALPWERAAFIRARACAGDLALGSYFLDAIRPFVWRRALDFGAIAEIRGMTHRIRDHYTRGQALGPGFDLKRGRGGIRDVEFFAQIHQLIHGGRDISLRSGHTPSALTSLAEAGHVDGDVAKDLIAAYRSFRTIEHRLQMVDDQQTHSLPLQPEAMDNVARLHGLESAGQLIGVLQPLTEFVSFQYDALDGADSHALPQQAADMIAQLAALGLPDPQFVAERIASWRSGGMRALRTPASQNALEAVLPELVKGVARAGDARAAIIQLDAMLSRLPSSINLFRLLEARPQLMDILINILCFAPTLAEELGRRAELLDGLIDATALDELPEIDALRKSFRHPDAEDSLELKLDRVRREVGERRFALGVQILEAASDPIKVSRGYARVAEAAVNVVADAVIAEFETQHGRVKDSEFVILALGRMGGGELTHASDLDLVYLFTGDFGAESDGRRPLGAVHYYNRLAQRVTAGLSVPTAAGPLYEVDTRLRPSGADGPLVVSVDAFAKYQREDAWTWEHLALNRARVIHGSQKARGAIGHIIRSILAMPRERNRLIADAAKMREDMQLHKPPKGALDIKLLPGGLVDLEFSTHVLQLSTGIGLTHDLHAAIAELIDANRLPNSFLDAYMRMTRLLVTLRLIAPDLCIPSEDRRAVVVRACGAADWDDLMQQIDMAQKTVSDVWQELTSSRGG